MICSECRHKQHTKCRGGTWCACQHRPQVPEAPTDAEYAALAASRDEEDEAFDATMRQRSREVLDCSAAEYRYSALGIPPAAELAGAILTEFGAREVSELGASVIPDWLWTVCKAYGELSDDDRFFVDEMVAKELYGL